MLKQLPSSIGAPFVEWCERGGHKVQIKKNKLIIKKGENFGVIEFDRNEPAELYQLNEYLSVRYELFLKQYLKYGKGFIAELRAAMANKYYQAVKINTLRMVA